MSFFIYLTQFYNKKPAKVQLFFEISKYDCDFFVIFSICFYTILNYYMIFISFRLHMASVFLAQWQILF